MNIRKVAGAFGIALGILLVAGFAWIWIAPCALGGCVPLDDLAAFESEGSELLDVNGEPFALLATVNRRIVPLDSLPPHLPEAFLAIEDRRFYSHHGVDLWRTAGALWSNLRSGGVEQGGSSITQQLARNLFPEWLPYRDRNVRRKVLEARVARQIEKKFDKNKILELYLNHIYLGNGAYGVEAAALTYFGKSASDVTLAEAATLAALPQAPSRVNPRENPEATTQRRNLVLSGMVEAGFVGANEASSAQEETLVVDEVDTAPEGPESAYFVELVRRELEEVVGNRFYTAGLRIHTTLDRRMQAVAEAELENQLTSIESGRYGAFSHTTYAAREEGTPAEYLQGAVVVMETATGEVRALVGGRDFNDSKFDRATQALRQPGSAFKPFLFASALEYYRSPVRQVEDAPLQVSLTGGRVWEPRNYGNSYAGTVTLRDALVHSRNTAAVRVAQDVGLRPAVELARNLGITTDMPDFPSTALGAAEVRPIELVAAYAALANGGSRVRPHLIRRVEDRSGQVLWETNPRPQPVLDPAVAFVLTSMLRDVVDRGTGAAVRAAGFSGPAAGKTGTTNNSTDVWFVGYTPDLAAGIWIGFDEPRAILRGGASGGALAAPTWGRMMTRIYEDRPQSAEWRTPSGVMVAEVDRATGDAINPECPAQGPVYSEYFIRHTPAPGSCWQYDYPYSYYDSLYGSSWDEFGVYGESRYDSLRSEGIDWPELDALRERARATRDSVAAAQAERAISGVPIDGLEGLFPPIGVDPVDLPANASEGPRLPPEVDLPGVPIPAPRPAAPEVPPEIPIVPLGEPIIPTITPPPGQIPVDGDAGPDAAEQSP